MPFVDSLARIPPASRLTSFPGSPLPADVTALRPLPTQQAAASALNIQHLLEQISPRRREAALSSPRRVLPPLSRLSNTLQPGASTPEASPSPPEASEAAAAHFRPQQLQAALQGHRQGESPSTSKSRHSPALKPLAQKLLKHRERTTYPIVQSASHWALHCLTWREEIPMAFVNTMPL